MKNDVLENSFKPCGSLILIHRDPAVTEIGGIKLPDRAVSRTNFGKVIAVGPGPLVDGKNVPLPIQVGDRVMFDEMQNRFVQFDMVKKTATLLSDDFEDYSLVPEVAVMGVMA